MVSALAGIGAVLALTVATGYFVAQEFAFVAADRSRLAAEAERGDVRAQRALSVMSRLSFMLSGAQLGITVTALVVGFIAEPATSALIEPVLAAAGAPTAAADGLALATGFVLATVVQMVLGELLPKNLALARAEPLAKFLASSTLVYLRIAGPIIRLFDSAATRLVRAVGVEPIEELHHGATLTELGDIIGESRRSGRLPTDLSALLERALTFGERTASEVMVPRPDVVAVAATTTVRNLTGLIAAAGHTNYPIYGRDIDDVIGTAGVREVVAHEPGAADRPIADLVRPALLIPETLPLHNVIARMRDAGEEFASVFDEYGGLAGILTFEDIAEELIGPIADENDVAPAVPGETEGVWVLDAAMRIAQVRDLTGLALPTAPAYDTLSGLVMAHTGRLPQAGDRIDVDLNPDLGPPGQAEIEVLGLRRRVARSIRLRRLPQRRRNGEEGRPWTS